MKKIIALGLILALSACTTSRLPPVTTNRPAPIVAPTIAPADFGTVHWTVRDLAGLKDMVAQAEATGQTNMVFYIMTQDEYEVLAKNLAETKRYIADQQASNEFLQAGIRANATPSK